MSTTSGGGEDQRDKGAASHRNYSKKYGRVLRMSEGSSTNNHGRINED